MQFFTRAWANHELTEEASDAVCAAYARHMASLELPPAVAELAALYVHDAYILDVKHLSRSGELRLRLRCGDLQRGYCDAWLHFTGVTIDPAHAAVLFDARRAADVEILHDEVDRSGHAYEYRLLLYPEGEVTFMFEQVSISRQPVAGRHAN
jgi:hypothetical protein